MVGKPNIASETPTGAQRALDQEREASMADEGGAAGAELETEGARPNLTSAREIPSMEESKASNAWLWVAAGAAFGIAGAAIYKAIRNRAEPALQPE